MMKEYRYRVYETLLGDILAVCDIGRGGSYQSQFLPSNWCLAGCYQLPTHTTIYNTDTLELEEFYPHYG